MCQPQGSYGPSYGQPPSSAGFKLPGMQMPSQGQLKPAFASTYTPGNSWRMDGFAGGRGPSMYQPWMEKTYTPPGGYTPPADFGPITPNPPPQQPPGQPAPPPGDFGPLSPGRPPATPGAPSGIPGVPQHLASQITMDPSGRMLYGPDKQPVKWDGTQLRFDDTPFNPGAGQFGQYGKPGAGGFSLDTTGGMNRISGGANGSQLFSPEGLNQGSNFAPQNFVNYLNSYRR